MSRLSFIHFATMILILTSEKCFAQTPPENKGKVLLAIFAHPDDEGSVAPVLAKYAAEGVKVYLAVATDGRLGTANTAIPAGDSLAAVRGEEIKCAAQRLGIEPPIMLGLQDQFKMAEGNKAMQLQINTLREKVTALFEQLSPDAVITWNPAGGSGSNDHRLVSSVVTEVFEIKKWPKQVMLFYVGMPTQNVPPKAPRSISSTDVSFLTTRIEVSDADISRGKESTYCHKSQINPQMLEAMHNLNKIVYKNTWYFRPHSGGTEMRSSLF